MATANLLIQKRWRRTIVLDRNITAIYITEVGVDMTGTEAYISNNAFNEATKCSKLFLKLGPRANIFYVLIIKIVPFSGEIG